MEILGGIRRFSAVLLHGGPDENSRDLCVRVSLGYFMTQISSRQPGIPLFLFRPSRRERRSRSLLKTSPSEASLRLR